MERKVSGRTVLVALGISIILNLFLAAVIGGHLWRVHQEARSAGVMAALTHAESGLSPQDAAAFDSVLHQNAPRYVEALRQLRLTRRALHRQVNADTFDPVKTRQALNNWRTAWNGFLDAFDDTLIEALSKMSPEGRRHLSTQSRPRFLSP